MTSLNQSIACWLWEFHRLWLPENPGPDRGMLTISTVFSLKGTVAFVSQFILMRPLFEGSVYYFGRYKHYNLAPLNFLATKHSDINIMSFQSCGISVDIDGTHDGEIHCLKVDGVAADVHENITMETDCQTSVWSSRDWYRWWRSLRRYRNCLGQLPQCSQERESTFAF